MQTLVNNILSNAVYYPINFPLSDVNSLEEVFVFDNNGVLQKCNYQANTYTPLGVSNNNSLTPVFLVYKQTVEDNILALNYNTNKIYCFNTNPSVLTSKSITATLDAANIYNPCINSYFISGNDAFIMGGFNTPSFTIGNQTMPLLGNASTFVTKFNIQSDFSFRRQEEEGLQSKTESSNASSTTFLKNDLNEKLRASAIEATVAPNPAKNMLQVTIKQSNAKENSSFLISITNSFGVTMLQRSTKQNMLIIDISRLIAGIYYVTVLTDKGDKTTQMFMKE